MSLLVLKAKEQINNWVINAAKKAMAEGLLEEGELTAFTVEVPANRDHGDYAVNAAMVWARLFHKAPRQIAEILVANGDFEQSYINPVKLQVPALSISF